MKKILLSYAFFLSLVSITLFASKSPDSPPYTHTFFNAHGLRGVLDPSDRWDIYGNPIYADEKESESSERTSEDDFLTITEEKEEEIYEEKLPLNRAEDPLQCEKLEDKQHSPKMEKIWHYHLSWDDIAKKIYGDTESDSENYFISSDDDSTDSEKEYTDDEEELIDFDAKIEPITEHEKKHPKDPILFTVNTEEPEIAHFLKACYTGCEDRVIVEFLKKYQSDKDVLYQLMNQTYPTPLFWATVNGNLYIVKKLLPYVLFTNPFDRSALFYAVFLKRKKIVKFLLAHHFYFHPDDPALRYHPHIDLISRAKTLKKCINSERYLAWTTYAPLKAAVRNNDYEMVKLLINAGARDSRSIQTATISHTTDPRILELLVDHHFISEQLLNQKIFDHA